MAEYGERQSVGSQHPAAGSPLHRISVVVNWQRPLRTSTIFLVANSIFWFVTFTQCRLFCLVCLSVAALVLVQSTRKFCLAKAKGAQLWRSMTGSWEMIDSRAEDESAGGTLQITDSWTSFKLFMEETSSFKQQNPGKFCLLVCSLCSFLAILGRYIPGIVLSYVLVLGIFLWPLVSSCDFGLWLDPVLQKLDFGLGPFLQKIKENHEKRLLQAQAERENIEADLSSLFPKLDSAVYRELSISDTEPSEVTWTENGTFNLSEEHTPQTENSEDLDRPSDQEEPFAGGLPEFPSLDNGQGTNKHDDDDDDYDDEEDLGIGLTGRTSSRNKHRHHLLQDRAAPAPKKLPDPTLQLVERMAGDVIAAAVTAAIHKRLEATIGATITAAASPTVPPPPPQATDVGPCPSISSSSSASTPPAALAQVSVEDSDSDAEDFELLDQAELEQLEGELGLGIGLERAAGGQANPSTSTHPSTTGFFSKLLGRH